MPLIALLPLLLGPSPALSRAMAQEPVRQAEIEAAIDRGAAFLQALHDPTGRAKPRKPKRANAPKERVGLRALTLYTMLKSGVEPEDPATRQLLTELGFEGVDQTYDVSCLLLALAAHDPIANRPWIEELARQLLGWQEQAGDWSYPGLIVDLSNTQYAALGLWAAARAGVEIEPAVWQRLARAVLGYQDETGGFSYTAGGKGGSGSMTAAGVGTLAICELQLRLAGELSVGLAEELAAARARGLAWLDEFFSVTTNPRSGAWHYYYLYGLERMGALAGAPRIGAHDWYQEGADLLVRGQDEAGSWGGGTDLSETCFALLFLKRATAADSGPRRPLTGGGRRLEEPAEEAAGGALALKAEGQGPLKVWVEEWSPAETARWEWPEERGLGPHVERVEYYAGERAIGVVLGDAAHPAAGARFALEWVPPRTGTLELRARVWVAPPPAEGGRAEVLESRPLAVEVERALPAWIGAVEARPGENLAPAFRPKASASSELKHAAGLADLGYGPERAVDGLARTPWLADPKDEKRALKVSYRKAEAVDRIRVVPAFLSAHGAGYLARPVEIEVKLNGGKPLVVRLEEELRPAWIELQKPVRIKRLDVRILELAPGEHPAVGIGEVELLKSDG